MEFAYEFADLLKVLFNKSLWTEVFPAIWKNSYITPVKKIPNPESENDIRPISLTSNLPKILEDIDPLQLSSLRCSSTTYCTLYMIHN